MKALFIAALLVASVSFGASPCPHPARSQSPKLAFVKTHLCPSTGKHLVHCPGYVIDHIEPLCDCSLDTPANMQWEKVAAAKKKDRLENRLCQGKISKAQYDKLIGKP